VATRTRKPRKAAPRKVGPTLPLIADTREPEPLLWQLSQEGFDVSRETLETGDFLWLTKTYKSVCVERKTIGDFLGSLSGTQANGRPRIVNQLTRLVTFDYPVLLLEGTLSPTADGKVSADGRASSWSHHAVDNFLLTAQQAGVLVVRCRKGHVPERLRSLVTYFDKPEHLLEVKESKVGDQGRLVR
jgi:ERCC4-type nuclease